MISIGSTRTVTAIFGTGPGALGIGNFIDILGLIGKNPYIVENAFFINFTFLCILMTLFVLLVLQTVYR